MGPVRVIDTKMHGSEEITAAYLVEGSEKVALVETGPRSVVDNVLAGLTTAGIDHLDWILVTHIHLDHAGAAGTLAQRFPEARVGVHGVGAPHLVDPSKLWSSASRIYGDRMEEMWGGIDPLPEERVTIIDDGDEIDLGGRTLRAVETPGHAYHHHAYLDSEGGLFTGDALGVRLPGVRVIRPATPPPEFHLEKAIASIDRLRSLGANTLIPTHFGPIEGGDADADCDAAVESLRKWGEWVTGARRETSELDEAASIVERSARADLQGRIEDDAVTRLEQTTSFWMNTWGYMRYFDKEEAAD